MVKGCCSSDQVKVLEVGRLVHMGPVCPGLLEEESRRVRVSSRMGDSEAIGWSDVREVPGHRGQAASRSWERAPPTEPPEGTSHTSILVLILAQ